MLRQAFQRDLIRQSMGRACSCRTCVPQDLRMISEGCFSQLWYTPVVGSFSQMHRDSHNTQKDLNIWNINALKYESTEMGQVSTSAKGSCVIFTNSLLFLVPLPLQLSTWSRKWVLMILQQVVEAPRAQSAACTLSYLH